MSHDLTIEPLGQTLAVEDGQTILDAALRGGVHLPHACGQGYCGTCKVKILDGAVDHGAASSFALMDYEREEGMALACCATLEDDTAIEAEIEVDADARDIPVRDFVGSIVAIEDLTPTIKAFHIALGDDGIDFQAGQYVDVAMPAPIGHRAFSLANPPASGSTIELNVRQVPGGAGTTWMHRSLAVGDTIKLSGPYGRFFVRKSAAMPLIFCAGGSGLSSPRAMILDLLDEGCDLPITLVYGARNRAELYYHEAFLALAARYPNFTYVPTLNSEPLASDWSGRRQLVHEAAKEQFGNDFRGHKAYLCGPPTMIEACISTLMQGRLFERDIYTEKFFSAADAQQIRSPLFKRV